MRISNFDRLLKFLGGAVAPTDRGPSSRSSCDVFYSLSAGCSLGRNCPACFARLYAAHLPGRGLYLDARILELHR